VNGDDFRLRPGQLLPAPFYEDEAVRIYHGDSGNILAALEPGIAMFGWGDPPYNAGLKYGAETDDAQDAEAYWRWLNVRISMLHLVSQAVVIKHSAFKVTRFLKEWPDSRMAIWFKPFSSGFPNRGLSSHWEPLHVLKGAALNNAKDVFEVNAGNCNPEDFHGHPAQMPEKLAGQIIQAFTNPGDLIIDAFCGTGTMLRAAKDLGRRAVGIEIEEKWCGVAAKRMAQGVLPLFASGGGGT
jgi:site-specific DNA-methyltransferase (adenine-specific)